MRQYRVHLPALDIHTRVIESGSGIPVIFLHGNPDNADEWLPTIELLGDGYRCIALDLPGYGESPEPPASFHYTVRDQVAFLEEFLQVVNVSERSVLVMHDIGGVMGVAWAGNNYKRLKGILLTNTVAFEGFDWFPGAKVWGDESLQGKVHAAASMAAIGLAGGALFKQAFGEQNPDLNAEQLERMAKSFALNHAAKNTTLRQFREMLKPGFFAGYDKMVVDITSQIPSHVVWGARDPYIPLVNADKFGRAAVTVLPNQGHWVPLTAPISLTSALAELLAH